MDCHSPNAAPESAGNLVALVGQPNVGKSALFQRLTGRHVVVANFPGTTVEIARAAARFRPDWQVVDTPGVLGFPTRTEDEQVTAAAILDPSLRTAVQVGDSKHLRRTLALTIQLAETGVPLVLALNMADENEAWGVDIDLGLLSEHLGIPVVSTVATLGTGVDELGDHIVGSEPVAWRVAYPDEVEAALAEIARVLPEGSVTRRALALRWLEADPVVGEWLGDRLDPGEMDLLVERRDALQLRFVEPLPAVLQAARFAAVDRLVGAVSRDKPGVSPSLRARLAWAAMHPWLGLGIVAAVLYVMYWFVGVFGAATLVGLLEERLFGEVVNPAVTGLTDRLIPLELVRDMIVGEYGLWTMGMTYALALILPIVTTFFLVFGALEDSGYLPRLSVLTNRLFRIMGLNGRAVIPMVLGLGCVTMATLTTRTLESKRDRLLVILLLALAVPCSAQLGVVVGLLAGISAGATLIWGGVVVAVLLAVGALAARLVPGNRSILLTELPPLRVPRVSAIVAKTLARLEWYLKEVVPLFLIGSLILFVLDRSGGLASIIEWSEPVVVGWLGLPAATATAFVMGFLRRDFGAAGLFAMAATGALTAAQLVVAMVTVTLFVPCVASVLMIARERGRNTAAAITALVFPLAFLVGGTLARALDLVGWGA